MTNPGPPQGNPYGSDPYGSNPYGGQPQGGQSYGGAGAATGGPGPVHPRIKLAGLLVIIGAAVGVVGAIISLPIARAQALDAVTKSLPPGTQSPIDPTMLVTVSLVIGFVIAVIAAGLYILFAFKLRAGRNWARIVLTVLIALSILGTVFSLIGILAGSAMPGTTASASPVNLLLSLPQVVLMVVALIMMYSAPARAWFAAAAMQRAPI